MKKTILFFVFFIMLTSALAYGEYGAGTYGDGYYGSGTEEPVIETVEETSSSGGGGGGGAFSKRLAVGIRFKAVVIKGINSYFYFGNQKHTLKLNLIQDDWVEIEINSEPIILGIYLNETKVVKVDDDLLEIFLEKIKNKVVTLKLTRLEEEEVNETIIEDDNETYVTSNETVVEELPVEEVEEPTEYEGVLADEPEEKKASSKVGFIISGIIVVVGVVLYFLIVKRKGD